MSPNRRHASKRSNELPTSSIGSRCSAGLTGSPRSSRTKNAKVHSSFRISPLVEVMSNLSCGKENILRKMNFHGLMHLPDDISEGDRSVKLQFSQWLITKIDPNTGDLDLGLRGRIPIEAGDVGFVLGIPCAGDELVEHDPSKLELNKSMIRKNLIIDDTDEIDFYSIKKVLQRELVSENDDASAQAFMTAVVIYAVSYFLAPKGRPPKVNAEIFDSIVNPSRIPKLNWSSYVMKTLKDCSIKVRSDLLAEKSSVCLDGCLLFLQILYLDNIRFPSCTTRQYKVPRVSDFSFAKLNKLIKMDKRPSDRSSGEQYGVNELRHEGETFYSRGDRFREMLNAMNNDKPSTSTSSDLEKVLQYIDHENTDHKRRIRKAANEFAEKLCQFSDRHCEDVKSMLGRWISARLTENNGKHHDQPDNDAVPNFYKNPFKGQHSRNDTDVGKRQGNTKQPQANPANPNVVDLTGSDDSEDPKEAMQSSKGTNRHVEEAPPASPVTEAGDCERVFPPERRGTKRAANRTPYWIRKAIVEQAKGQIAANDAISNPDHEIGNTSGVTRGLGRRKVIVLRKRLAKKYKLPQVLESPPSDVDERGE